VACTRSGKKGFRVTKRNASRRPRAQNRLIKQAKHGASFQSVAVAVPTNTLRAWCSRSKAGKNKRQAAVIVREWPSGSIENNIERFLDFARNDRRRIRDIRTTIDESFRSLRKFSTVVFRPAVAGLLECARVLASLLGGFNSLFGWLRNHAIRRRSARFCRTSVAYYNPPRCFACSIVS
jgi:hypothetical protein